ncbi:MAG TPA: hypothetical protein VM029_04295 [Opitutaceae bacterium]|nr:hypothetical protein [Opitutaceae bacterium]
MFLVASLTAATARAEIRIVGTDLLGVEFSKALYECAGRHRLGIRLALDGSRPGLDQLKAGRADLALVVAPTDGKETPAGFCSVVVGYFRVLVLVPAACPLERISFDQLAAVFGSEGTTGAVRWSELGVGGEWEGNVVAAVAPEVGTGLALEHFRHVVLRGTALRSNVARFDSPADLAAMFTEGRRVLAIAAAPPAGAAAKILPVARRPLGEAFTPTAENVHAGHYPLRLPVRLVFRRETVLALKPLLDFLLGDGAVAPLTGAGVIAVPRPAREELVFALEKT